MLIAQKQAPGEGRLRAGNITDQRTARNATDSSSRAVAGTSHRQRACDNAVVTWSSLTWRTASQANTVDTTIPVAA